MSLFLSQPSTLCFRKPGFVRSSPNHSDGFSSSSFPQTPPCVIMYVDPCGTDPGKLVIRRAGDSSPIEKKLPMELTNEMRTIGTSNGWLTTLKDGVIGLQDIVASDADPKRISLPPLVTLPLCQTQIITNVAMSSSSPEEEDCIVAVKFLGHQLSFCRPAQSNSEWINIRTNSFGHFYSRVMYSKKDDMFHIPGDGKGIITSWDPRKNGKERKLQRLELKNIPNLTKANNALLDSCCKSEHLVESRTTGETFMVMLYKKMAEIMNRTARMKTEALMVFKLDDEGNAVYTQDMGDLCIFLTKSEPFCVPSSSFPDMYPNHVKNLDINETAVFNLADQKWVC